MTDDQDKSSKLKSILASAGRITKKTLRAGLITGAIAGSLFAITNPWGKWVYQVKTNYGVVITEADGDRIAIDEPGWYGRFPFLSTYESEFPLANQLIFLHGKTQPHEVITKDGVVIMAAASTFYSIKDLRQYAIENVREEIKVLDSITTLRSGESGESQKDFLVNPKEMIGRTLDSIIGAYIQKTEPKRMIHDRSAVEKEIFQVILDSGISERYGIELNSFNFTGTNYIPKVVEANANRQALEANAEGRKAAAEIDKKAIETLAEADAQSYNIIEKAINPNTPEEKERSWNLFRDLIKYRTIKDKGGDTVWVLPDSSSPAPVFQPKKQY